jgi:hypothetical protein
MMEEAAMEGVTEEEPVVEEAIARMHTHTQTWDFTRLFLCTLTGRNALALNLPGFALITAQVADVAADMTG